MRGILYIFLFFLVYTPILAQELPPIVKYSPEQYGGDNQNWMISQGPDKFIYIANSEGLLEFNGASWKLIPSPNNTIIRSVKVVNDRIYVGCFEDFGYYKRDSTGTLKFNSLIKSLEKGTIEDENIWSILDYNEWIIFQSKQHLYFYNTRTDSFKIINSVNIITKVFLIDDTVFYHVLNEGLFKIENGKRTTVSQDKRLNNGKIINIFPHDGGLLILTDKSGCFILQNNTLSVWKTPADLFIKDKSIFSGIQLKDKSVVIGTISNGIIHISKDGKVLFQINHKNGLSNNTVLSLFEDYENNIWAGLDNGINIINIRSAIRIYNDEEGKLGTVYSSALYNNSLYLGTNQGLFYRSFDDKKGHFKFISGTAGQVWNLFITGNNELLCGHHKGTFVVRKDKAELVDKTFGTWDFRPVPEMKNTLLQGKYDGFSILTKDKGQWYVRNKIDNFDNSSRYFEIKDHSIWISHGYKGVFKLDIDKDFTIAEHISKESELSLGKNSSLIKYKNDLLYASDKGIYKYDTADSIFKYDTIFSQVIEKNDYLSGKLAVTGNEKLWGFSKSNINYLEPDDLSGRLKIHRISIPTYLRKGMVGYENISQIGEERFLLGTSNGYITIDLSKLQTTADYLINLNSIELKNIGNNKIDKLNKNIPGEFNYNYGLLVFNYSVPEYNKFLTIKYQYKLEGFIDNWTEWSNVPYATFENLPFGNYTFKVRAKVGNTITKNIPVYRFTINKPWYFSHTAIIVYLLLFLSLFFITHRAYKRYYQKQLKLKQSANEKLIIRIKNEKLEQEIKSKNREMAISTMSIIKKNEVLSSIKKELMNIRTGSDEISSIIKLIDANINDSRDWKFFKEAFNNADKDFLDKIKELHPNLTPNDLRFCAYLRLNLSSKEIAPLLNISVRSVEIKRYRLRKKMNLSHDEGLISHILSI